MQYDRQKRSLPPAPSPLHQSTSLCPASCMRSGLCRVRHQHDTWGVAGGHGALPPGQPASGSHRHAALCAAPHHPKHKYTYTRPSLPTHSRLHQKNQRLIWRSMAGSDTHLPT